MEHTQTLTRLEGLVVFRGLLKDPAVAAMQALLAAPQDAFVSRAAAFEAVLFEKSTNWRTRWPGNWPFCSSWAS